jgi:hypothetical protein
MTHPEIELQTINQWHDIAELVVDISGVDCALIMRANQDSIEVLTGFANEDSPCSIGMNPAAYLQW